MDETFDMCLYHVQWYSERFKSYLSQTVYFSIAGMLYCPVRSQRRNYPLHNKILATFSEIRDHFIFIVHVYCKHC